MTRGQALFLAAALCAPARSALAQPQELRPPHGVVFASGDAQAQADYEAAKREYEAALAAIIAVPPPDKTFANTVKALETAGAIFGEKTQGVVFMAYVSPNEKLQAAAQQVEQDSGKYGVEVWARADLYQAVKLYADKKEPLQGEDAKLLEVTLRSFKFSGHGLAEDKKKRLEVVQSRLAVIQAQFEANINMDNGGLDVPLEKLDGLPADVLARLERTADGKAHVTLKTPDYSPVMKYVKDEDVRRQIQFLYNNRASEMNVPLLTEALRLRDESAHLLGYGSYPDLALDGRMAGSPERVWEFLNKLWPILRRQGDKELDDLLVEKRKEKPDAERVEPWDLSYYSDKVRKERYALDNEEVKKYFPAERVIEGTMRVYERILGVKFAEEPAPEAWSPDVKRFRVQDAKTLETLGYFYLDIYPRPGKYSHAAAFSIAGGRELFDGQDGYRKPVSVMVANFPKGAPGEPALLPHGDVQTFFHEFGHIMHQTLTKARYATMSGSNVAQDFVEAPSQMLENFVWQRQVLDEISGHYQTGEKLPDELFAKMKAARHYNNGIQYLAQLGYAMTDMLYHTAVPQETSRMFTEMMEVVGLVPMQAKTHPEASFGHLMGGYGAGYYGYLWSEVFADDVFTRFANEGLFNPVVGQAWRREVLERGSSRPEMDSLRAFLGREPSDKAFLDKLRGQPTVPAPAAPASAPAAASPAGAAR